MPPTEANTLPANMFHISLALHAYMCQQRVVLGGWSRATNLAPIWTTRHISHHLRWMQTWRPSRTLGGLCPATLTCACPPPCIHTPPTVTWGFHQFVQYGVVIKNLGYPKYIHIFQSEGCYISCLLLATHCNAGRPGMLAQFSLARTNCQ